MSIFDKKGMMIFPNPLKKKQICEKENVLLFTECYCSNAHNLISSKAKFDQFDGILLKISNKSESGMVALSPIYGCKTRISINIDLLENELYELSCPVCDTALPIFSKCHCGGDIFTLFLNKDALFYSFIGVCNRIGCKNAFIQMGDELITSARLEGF